MRSIGWLKFRYICKHRLLCITHKAIHHRFPEIYLNILVFKVITDIVGSRSTTS